ncbi:M23 family metallopeptidase [Vibrio sp. HENC-03]|uniref:M23 family metallopeptidase n=1 Tax=Vibrio sp. HENC-03 TaxID=992012 RepID=UPI00028F14D4|nr:M23 family metallopeptidase [Vibrio sp. HENC-03]EKM24282.1 peptidase M23 family protein [Vibrio sp. HENC-03]
MKDQLTISISNINGSKHWYFSKAMQRNFKTGLVAFILGLTATAILINHLYSQVDDAVLEQAKLTEQSRSMGQELSELKALKSELENDLSEREERVQLVSERLGELEKVLGVANESNTESLDARFDTAAITSNVRMVMLNQIPNGSPVGKARLSSGFGKRVHPVTKKTKMHRGLDFAVNTGTKVYASADGVIETTRRSSKGYGNLLHIQHSFGFSSAYAHLKEFKVKTGEFVKKGQLIAISGNTGLSSGPHLHYEVRFIGRAVNPRPFVDWNLNNFEDIFTKERRIRWESLIKTVEQRVAHQLQLSSPKAVLLAENSK